MQEELTERRQVVTFPVFDAVSEVRHGLGVVLPPLLFVDLVGDAHDGFETGLELVVVREGIGGVLEELL